MALSTRPRPIARTRAHRVPRPRASSSSARCTRRCSTTSRASDGCHAVALECGSGLRKATGTFYTPQPIADYRRAPHARSARPRRGAGAHPAAARRRSGDGQRRVSRRGLPLSGGRVRGRARSHRRLPLERHRRRGARRHQANDRGALPVRRRPQPDGGPARAAVAVARDAGRRSAAQLSRSSAAGRRQPARRLAREPAASADVGGAGAAPAACSRCSTTTPWASPCARRCRCGSRSRRCRTTRSSRCARRSGRSPR